VVYERIGRTYRSVVEKEPWCRNAKPVTEIGVLTLLIRGFHEGLPSSLMARCLRRYGNTLPEAEL
jgi:hypothetical protein